MRILALDLSLTAAGVALPDGSTLTLKPGKRLGCERLAWLRDEVLALTMYPDSWPLDLVAIEGYSYASRNGGERLGELGGVIRLALHEAGIRWFEVAPKSIKTYATNNGNAKKEAVLAEAIRRLDYQGSSHDEADALWLRALVLDHYGQPVVKIPEANRRALAGVEWPVLDDGVIA